jgi:predicted aldo/keto reductase-like oxidoreductase
MAKYRNDFFLATKTGERKAPAAYDEIRRSLDRLQTDNVDLIQLHNLVDETEWETALGPGGALEAAVRAKEEGLVKHIGVTGHGVTVAAQHKKSLESFPFDSVLLPYNYTMARNIRYSADLEALFILCRERGVAVQTIKGITRAPWGDEPHTASTWYSPFTDQASIDLTVHWVLGRAGVFLNTAGDINLLPLILNAANSFTDRPTDLQMSALAEQQQMAPLFT